MPKGNTSQRHGQWVTGRVGDPARHGLCPEDRQSAQVIVGPWFEEDAALNAFVAANSCSQLHPSRHDVLEKHLTVWPDGRAPFASLRVLQLDVKEADAASLLRYVLLYSFVERPTLVSIVSLSLLAFALSRRSYIGG